MRQIIKNGKQPAFFKSWKVEFRKRKGRSAKYEDLKGTNYDRLKKVLIDEQYHLCCYCCNRIDKESAHIEHFIPRNARTGDPDKQLDYKNMFASCNGYIAGFSTETNEFCGHRKDDWYDANYIISPLDIECERAFEFLPNGEIKPLHDGDARAKKMIEKIGLNTYALKKAREAAINVVYEEIGLLQGEINDSMLNDELEYYSKINSEGSLPAFCDAVCFLLKEL